MFYAINILHLSIALFILVKGIKYYRTAFTLGIFWYNVTFTLILLAAIYTMGAPAALKESIFYELGGFKSLIQSLETSTTVLLILAFDVIILIVLFFFTNLLTYILFPIFIVFILTRIIAPGITVYPPLVGISVLILLTGFYVMLILKKELRSYVKAPMIGLLAGLNFFLPVFLMLYVKSFDNLSIEIISKVNVNILFLALVSISLILELFIFAPGINRTFKKKKT
ncbi:MAG: hypothetical protein RBT69_12340 [Spirochaetia bacterium]|jgi:hypothetical protein|nr:hypothetical protein [Spirochaetia bacterium]